MIRDTRNVSRVMDYGSESVEIEIGTLTRICVGIFEITRETCLSIIAVHREAN